MRIIVFNKKPDPVIQTISRQVSAVDNFCMIDTNNLDEFVPTVDSAPAGSTVIVFFARTAKDLSCLESLNPALIDTKLIICLETQDANLRARSYALAPRMVIEKAHIAKTLPAVMEKMTSATVTNTK